MSNSTFRASVLALKQDLKPTIIRLQQKHKIPTGALLSEIKPHDFHDVARLHSLLLPIDVETLTDRMQDVMMRPSYSKDLSVVLKIGEKCVGCSLFLSSTSDQSAYLFAIIVSPSLRKTWATAWLKYMTFKHLLNCDIATILFEAYSENADTIKHANRVDAERLVNVPDWCV